MTNGLGEQLKNFITKYVPYKGASCPKCGKFCKTNHTDIEDGVRYHKCIDCDDTFQSFSKPNARSKSVTIPTSLDKQHKECLNNSIDTKKAVKKTKKLVRGRK